MVFQSRTKTKESMIFVSFSFASFFKSCNLRHMTPDRHYFDNVLLISEVLQRAHSRSGAYRETRGGGRDRGDERIFRKNTILVKSLITDYPKRRGASPPPSVRLCSK